MLAQGLVGPAQLAQELANIEMTVRLRLAKSHDGRLLRRELGANLQRLLKGLERLLLASMQDLRDAVIAKRVRPAKAIFDDVRITLSQVGAQGQRLFKKLHRLIVLPRAVQMHDPQVPCGIGPAGIAEVVAVYQDGVNGHWQIEEMFSAGDRVVVRWTGSGTHVGEVNGIPPTGKDLRVDAITIHRMADGKIAETWEVWDTLGFLQQIGVVPAG